jgi:precorrin-6B methylase 1
LKYLQKNSSFQALTSQHTWEFNDAQVEKLKTENKATADSITKETQTAVAKSFNIFYKGTGCKGSISILNE